MKLPVLLVAIVVLSYVLLASQPVRCWIQHHWSHLVRAGRAVCFASVALPVAGALVAAATGYTVFHDEATVLSITAAYLHHQPMYPGPTYPAEYGLLYGPVAYLMYAPPMLAGVQQVSFFQAWVALGLAATLVSFFLALRGFGRPAALTATASLGLFLCVFCHNAWAVKGDLWIVFFSALALWAALGWRPWPATLAVGLLGGLLLDIKVTTLLLALLPAILLALRENIPRWLPVLAFCLSLVVAYAFFRLPGIALEPYQELLRSASLHGSSLILLLRNLASAFWILLLPGSVVFMAWSRNRERTVGLLRHYRAYYAGVALAYPTAILTGAKNGAGPWHLMGLLVPTSFILAQHAQTAFDRLTAAEFLRPRSAPLIAASCLLCLIAGDAVSRDLWIRFHGQRSFIYANPHAVEQDLRELVRVHPAEHFQMGVSDLAHYDTTFSRALLIERGSPLFVDPDVLNEDDLAHKPLPPALLDVLDSCRVGPWLIPDGGAPFSMPSLYSLDRNVVGHPVRRDLYPPAFRSAFLAHFHPTGERSRFFTIWRCNAPTRASSTASLH